MRESGLVLPAADQRSYLESSAHRQRKEQAYTPLTEYLRGSDKRKKSAFALWRDMVVEEGRHKLFTAKNNKAIIVTGAPDPLFVEVAHLSSLAMRDLQQRSNRERRLYKDPSAFDAVLTTLQYELFPPMLSVELDALQLQQPELPHGTVTDDEIRAHPELLTAKEMAAHAQISVAVEATLCSVRKS